MRGRRPKTEIQVNPQAPAVQDKIDAVALVLLDKFKTVIEAQLGKGALDKLRFDKLLREFNSLLRSLKKPNAIIAAASAPSFPQLQRMGRRDHAITNGTITNKARLLESQESFLTNNGEAPGNV